MPRRVENTDWQTEVRASGVHVPVRQDILKMLRSIGVTATSEKSVGILSVSNSRRLSVVGHHGGNSCCRCFVGLKEVGKSCSMCFILEGELAVVVKNWWVVVYFS
jgi:hypothetical protein